MFRRKHPTRRELEHLIVELREILDEQERLLARLSAFPRLARWPGWTVPRR